MMSMSIEQLGKLGYFINGSKKINSSTLLVSPGFGRQQTFISEMETRARIFKLLRSPRIDPMNQFLQAV
jgi:hypothetical protein